MSTDNSHLTQDVDIHKNIISEFDTKIQDLESTFEKVLKKYNLNVEILLEKQKKYEDQVQCPYNKNHIVSKKNYEKHCKRCELISKNINTKLSLPNPPSSQFFYTNTNTISLLRNNTPNKDNSKDLEFQKEYESNNNLPPYEIQKFKNDEHIICKLKDDNGISSTNINEKSIDEKLKEYLTDISLSQEIRKKYQHSQKIDKSFEKMMEIVEEKKAQMENTKKSKAQLHSEQRDYKRRRKSYRAKNIKITKRSATQIQKDLIDSFVKDYELYLEIERDLDKKAEKEERRKRKKKRS